MSENEMSNELFKQLPGFPDVECNSDGFVRRIKDKKTIGIYYSEIGDRWHAKYYECPSRGFGGRQRTIQMFTFVATLFIDNPNNFRYVKSINENNSDYRSVNLQWTKNIQKKQKINFYED